MTPEEKELAKKRALAKARARARSNGQTMVSQPQATQAEPISGSPTPRTQPVQGQLDQLGQLSSLDRFFKGNGGRAATMGLQTANGLTWGGLDRGMAGLEAIAPGGAPKLPGQSRDREYFSGIRQDLREQHPVSALAGDAAGVIGGGLPLDDLLRKGGSEAMKRLPQGKSALQQGARYGARLGGLAAGGLAHYGLWKAGADAGNREAEEGRSIDAQERVDSLTSNPNEAAFAAAAGPVASGLYRAGRGAVTGRVTPKNVQGGGGSAPSTDAIREMKAQAYQDADALGVAYTPDAYAGMVAKIENVLESAGADSQLNSSVSAMLRNMQKRVGDQPITMQTIDKIRQQVRENVISPAHRAARDGDIRLGNIIIDEIDDFVSSGIGAVSGNGQRGGEAIERARALNSVWRKSQALQDAAENAQLRAASTGSGGNFENALRQEIRKIYQNPKKVAGFSKAEREAMRKVIEGDFVQNRLRDFGKLSPHGSGLMAALGVGTTVANPIIAPVWLSAMGAKHMAQRGIKNKFDELDEMVREGANSLPMKNITPQSGTPPSAPAGALPKKGGYSKKDKALDATAVGLVAASNAGTADAQETSGSALGAAQQRVTDLEGLSAQIEADLAMLNDVNADPKQLQMILQRRVNPELAIDGVIGPQTRQAISSMRTQLVNEQDKMRAEIGSARERATELEQRQIYADNSGNPMVKAGMEQLPLVGTALGALIGLRGRGGAVKKSRLAADALENQANSLLNPAALPKKSVTGPNSLNARAANLNEFWRLGGAGENVPFKMNAKGEWANKGGAVDPSELYKPKKNPFRTTDAGFIAGGLGESALATQYLGESKEALKAAEARLQQAEESGNLAAYEQAMAEIEQQKMMIQIWTSMQRAGLGVAGFRGMAALKSPYANARPNLGGAQQEQALLLQGIQRGKTKLPQKPRKKPPQQAPANDR